MDKIVILLIFILSSCSTIFNSGSQSFVAKADGDKDGVEIEVVTSDTSYKSKLPSTLISTPSSFSNSKIKIIDKCFNSTSYEVKKSITPSFWANFLLYGTTMGTFGLYGLFIIPVGMSIDYYNGYMWKLDKVVIVPVTANGKC